MGANPHLLPPGNWHCILHRAPHQERPWFRLRSASISADEAENHHHFGSSAFISASVSYKYKTTAGMAERDVFVRWIRVHFVEGFPETDRAGGMTGDKVCKYGLIRGIIGSGDGFQNLFHHSGASGCVTWELILDGYSESSYSATPRFAASRLPWFRKSSTSP